jgi:two-component system, NarL family, invasion response regulator UvrY
MRILIADDHPIFRRGLAQILASDDEMTVIGEAGDGEEALQLARSREWDVAVLDYSMPGQTGLDVLNVLKREFPERPVLILSMHAEDDHGLQVLKAGGAGYISKERAPEELTGAIRKIAGGGKYVSAGLAEILASELSHGNGKPPHEDLSDQEYRVMWLLASGSHIRDIALQMKISPSTVSTYRARILRKLGVGNNAKLVEYAVRHRLIQ